MTDRQLTIWLGAVLVCLVMAGFFMGVAFVGIVLEDPDMPSHELSAQSRHHHGGQL